MEEGMFLEKGLGKWFGGGEQVSLADFKLGVLIKICF